MLRSRVLFGSSFSFNHVCSLLLKPRNGNLQRSQRRKHIQPRGRVRSHWLTVITRNWHTSAVMSRSFGGKALGGLITKRVHSGHRIFVRIGGGGQLVVSGDLVTLVREEAALLIDDAPLRATTLRTAWNLNEISV